MSYPFKYIKNETIALYAKTLFCLVMCIGFTVAADLSTFTNARFICALVFGYVC